MLQTPSHSFSFEAIGTAWTIELYEALSEAVSGDLQEKVHARIEDFDRAYSRFRKDSLVTKISQQAGEYILPDDARRMMDFYHSMYESSDGLVTPLIGQSLSDAGYDAAYSLKPGDVSGVNRWEDVIAYDYPVLTVKEPVLLDFGAAGKGYLADIIGQLIDGYGITRYCVDAGGDIVVGEDKVRIGLEHPSEPGKVIGVATIAKGSLCGSSGNRRSWGKYHHILHPETLESPRHIAALWAYAETGLEADGLATALFFVKPEVLKQRYNFEYAIINADMSLEYSRGFPAEFF